MNSFSVYIEIGKDGWCTLWVGSLLGFFLNEPSQEEAEGKIPLGIRAYLKWLQRYGEQVDLPESVVYRVVQREEVDIPLANGEYKYLFDCDRVEVGEEEVEKAIRWMGFVRSDLMTLMDILPEGAMEWRRHPAHPFSVSRYLGHIARAEWWYLSRFWPDLSPPERDQDPLTALAEKRALAMEKLRGMTQKERRKVVEVDGELWTARKILGRFLYHERYHIRSIARIALKGGLQVPEGLAGWHSYG